jgi:mRNA interferase MazF
MALHRTPLRSAGELLVGIESGLKHDSSIHCDELASLPKTVLTNYVGYVGSLSADKTGELNHAMKVALDITNIS